jgi:predicted RNA methylase
MVKSDTRKAANNLNYSLPTLSIDLFSYVLTLPVTILPRTQMMAISISIPIITIEKPQAG